LRRLPQNKNKGGYFAGSPETYLVAAGEVVVGGLDRRGSLELRRPTPLTDFISASFGQHYTRQTGTCYATASGNTGAIGSFNAANVTQIDMATSSGATKDK
jgi:hypothetical protein